RAQPLGQRLSAQPAGEDRTRRDFGVERQRGEAAERAADLADHVLRALAAGGIDHHDAVLLVDQRVGAAGLDERARQQVDDELVLETLALAPAGLAAFL